ncbi:MAG TPA: SRPBCC family protein [Actinomycetota bacterium]
MEAPMAGRRANALKREIVAGNGATSTAPPEVVFDALTDLQSHLLWGGEQQRSKMRLVAMDAPEGPAGVGTEFRTEGLDPNGRFTDTSVVTEADRPRVFEFVTEAHLHTKKGKVVDWTVVHRYELAPQGTGCRISYQGRVTRISEVPGMLAIFNVPVLSALGAKAWDGLSKRGVRNLARVAEERAKERGEGG